VRKEEGGGVGEVGEQRRDAGEGLRGRAGSAQGESGAGAGVKRECGGEEGLESRVD